MRPSNIVVLQIAIFLIGIQLGSAQNLSIDSTLGYNNSRIIASQMGIYNDAEKTAYVAKVGNRLIAQLEKPLFEYQFYIVPDPIPNAFAIPGGYLYITTGLILLIESEDELACIMGHEIIHSNNRHAVKQAKKSILPKLLELPGDLITLITPRIGTVLNSPIKGANSVIFASYSKGFETEADKLGTELAARAGYDPLAMNTILTRLSDGIELVTGQVEKQSYLSDHPFTPKRVSRVEKNSAKLKWEKSAPSSANILKEFEGTLVGYSPGIGVIRENQFLHPHLDFKIDFPKGWTIQNQPTSIGAYSKDQKSVVALSFGFNGSSPEETGKKYLSQFTEKDKLLITESKTIKVNNRDAYIIKFKDQNEKDTATAFVLWIKLDKYLLNIIGLTDPKSEPLLKKSIESIHKLSSADKKSFTYKAIKIVTAKKNETVTQISERTDNVFTPAIIALINSCTVDEKLKKGRQLKIAVELPYKVE